jgi:transcriptional regulator with XRE-family HTH domain
MVNTREDYILYKRYIEEKGGNSVSLDVTYNHPRLYFTYKGQRRFVITSRSPSDWRVAENVKRTINQLFNEIEKSTPEELADDLAEDEKAADRADARTPKLVMPTNFGSRLQYAREQSRMSRADLANLSSVPEEVIAIYESENAEVGDPEHALKLSTALKTTLAYLVGKEDERMSDIGRRVSAKRTEKNLTLGMVAEQAGVPVQQLTNLETGIYPNFAKLGEVARVLGTTEDYLRTGIGEETIWQRELETISTAEALGAFIRVLRIKMNINQMQLAEKVGEKWATEISRTERGLNTRWIIKNHVPLSNALNFYPADLLKVAERVLANETAARAVTREADRAAAKVQPVTEPTPPSDFQRQLADHPSSDAILDAIREEANLTRALLARQHQELLAAISSGQTESLASLLHTMIDNILLKKK